MQFFGMSRKEKARRRKNSARKLGTPANIEKLEDRKLLTVVVESGDFATEVGRLKDMALEEASGDYDQPTTGELASFETLAATLKSGDLAAADSQAAALGYEVVEFTDTVSGDVYHGLRETLVGGTQTKGWGSYFVNPEFNADAMIEIPHPLHDTHSWDVGAKAFRDSGARGFLMAGAHRDANGADSADVAHRVDSMFHQVHEAWMGTSGETDTWQIHGFDIANHTSFPTGTELVLSNGDGSVTDEVVDLDSRFDANGFLSHVYNTLAPAGAVNTEVNGAVSGSTFSGLAGTTNVQGDHSQTLGGTFVHVELGRDMRFIEANRDLAAGYLAESLLAESSFVVTDSQITETATGYEVTVDFNEIVDATSLQMTDLLVDGVAIATGVVLDDADTATFTFGTLPSGAHSIGLDAMSMTASDGTALGDWIRSLEIATSAQYAINHSPRLQLGDAPLVGYGSSATDQVEIMWQTLSAGSGTQDSFLVEYRLAGSADAWNEAPGTSQIAIPTGGRINHYTTITGLDYGTDYEYRVQHLQGDVVIDEYNSTFQTRLSAGDQTPFTFAAYGDSADIDDIVPFRDVQAQITAGTSAFALLLGDNVYDSGTHNESDARFDPNINPEAAEWNSQHIDYVGFGNHDVYTDGGEPGEDNFSAPIPVAGVTSPVSVPAGEHAEHNYSFDYGNVHFATFDTNSLHNATRLDEQLTWLEADLAASSAQWTIVFGHHPVTGSPDKPEDASENYYQQVVPRLLAAGVDVLMMGHSHTYHRTYPLTGQSVGVETFVLDTDNAYDQGAGLVQVVAGTGGKSLRSGSFSSFPFNAAGFTSDTTPEAEYGFAQVSVTQNQLTVSYIAADDGATLDEFTINAGVDTMAPNASVTTPTDNGADDFNPANGAVAINTAQPEFKLRLTDSSGIHDTTVTSATVSMTKDGVALVEGTDYSFSFDAATDVVTLTSLAGDFVDGNFVVTLSGGADQITDGAGNAMAATTFAINIDTAINIVSFQQGVDSYAGTVDTYVEQEAPTVSYATDDELNIDNSTSNGGQAQALLRFDDLFGTATGQIPTTTTIQSAKLYLNVTNSGHALQLHRMLNAWTDTDTWNSLAAGISADDTEATATPDWITGSVSSGILEVDVLASLQAWQADPTQNFGWAILPTGGNGVDFDSAEGATPPRLEVQFGSSTTPNPTPPPPPAPPTPLYESFENGLGSEWVVTSVDPDARVAIRDLATEGIITDGTSLAYTQNGNSHSLSFDSTRASGDSNKDLGLAIWSVDLSNFNDAILTFHHFELSDETDTLANKHTTNAAGDGVAISVNGSDWYLLENQKGDDLNRTADGLWQLVEIDLASEITRINSEFPTAGLSLSSDVQLKWSHYDDRSLGDDGWAIDEVRIESAASSATFTTAHPNGAFHRFNLAGEDGNDYYYRAATFGNVDASTPILVSTHGETSAFSYDSFARRWHRFVDDPANGVDSLIVVTPVFVRGERFDQPIGHHRLSWNATDDAAADLALLSTVDAIAAAGVGDASQLYLWGFSAGGQFTTRFTAAHPDRVAAAVVGGPGSQILPTNDVAWPYGFGEHYDFPAPTGVTPDIDAFLRSRMMFWVGENDNDPNHPLLDTSTTVTSLMGEDRVERSVNAYEAMVEEASARGISPTEFEFELFVAADDAHGWGEDDVPGIYEFLFRDRGANEMPIQVHPRVATTATAYDQSISLPQNVAQLEAGEQFFIEFWLQAPNGSTTGVRSGQLDLYVDPEVATLNTSAIDHGSVFNVSTGSSHDAVNDGAFIRSFTGTTNQTGIGVGEYALFGRLELTADMDLTEITQLAAGLMKSSGADFQLEDMTTHRTDFMPFEKTTVANDASGTQGVVYNDLDGDGVRDANETGVAGQDVSLQTTTGQAVTLTRGVEPDDIGSGAYVNPSSPWAMLSAVGLTVINTGVRAFQKTINDASTGDTVFSSFTQSGLSSTWEDGERSLRIDFNSPTSRVSIDAVATSGGNDFGRLEVFDAAGNSLQTFVTTEIDAGNYLPMVISRPAADIAYAIASGHGTSVRLDNLEFDVQPVVTTDANGEYRLTDLDAGTFRVASNALGGWTPTSPLTGTQTVVMAAGEMVANRDFGQQTASLTPGVSVSPINGESTEAGGTATFSVVLDSPPTDDVTILLSSSDLTEGTLLTSSLTFTPLNWSTAQSVVVNGVNDDVDDGDVSFSIVTAAAISADADYNGVNPADVSVTNTDDDTAGISVGPTSGLITTEAGGADSFAIVLDSQPTANVTIGVSSNNTAEGVASTSSVIFTPSDWNQPQTVTVTGTDDSAVDGDINYSIITNAAVSADPNYNGMNPIDVNATNEDDDVAVPEPMALYFSLTTSDSDNFLGLTGGVARDEDVIVFDGNTFIRHFDGSDVGVKGDIDALAMLSETEMLFSLVSSTSLPGISGTVDDSDIVKFTATQWGDDTAGTLSLYFDASDVGLTNSGEDIDAIDVLDNGDLLISTKGTASVPGFVPVSGADEDVLRFTPGSLGTNTAGSWSVHFDGSDVGLKGEDVDAISADSEGNLQLSTVSSFSVTGVSGDDEDVFSFTPLTTGTDTSGTFAPTLLFDGSAYGLNLEDIDGFDMAPLPATSPLKDGDDLAKEALPDVDTKRDEWITSVIGRFRTHNYVASTGFSFLSNIHRLYREATTSTGSDSATSKLKTRSNDAPSSQSRLDDFFSRYDNILTSELLSDVLK